MRSANTIEQEKNKYGYSIVAPLIFDGLRPYDKFKKIHNLTTKANVALYWYHDSLKKDERKTARSNKLS